MTENNLKNIRKDRGLTQVKLAEIMDVEQGTVQRHEAGTRDMNTDVINKYATALKCHPSEIMNIDTIVVRDKKEEAVINAFRELSEADQNRFIKMAQGWNDEGN